MGLKEPSTPHFPTLLSMRPSSPQFPPWGLPASLTIPHLCPFHSGDPCFFTAPTFLPLLSSFLSCPCVKSYSPFPFLHDPVMARLWGWERE